MDRKNTQENANAALESPETSQNGSEHSGALGGPDIDKSHSEPSSGSPIAGSREPSPQNLLPHLGTIEIDVAGYHYYDGYLDRGDRVTFKRNPYNTYDCNAIAVYNSNRDQAGHVPAGVAAVFSPLMATGQAWLEGHVFYVKGADGWGRCKRRARAICTVQVYSAPSVARQIHNGLQEVECGWRCGGLYDDDDDDQDFEVAQNNDDEPHSIDRAENTGKMAENEVCVSDYIDLTHSDGEGNQETDGSQPQKRQKTSD